MKNNAMKKHFLLLTIVFVSLLTACSKKSDDVTPDGQNTAKAGFYCKVDGKDFAPDFYYATSVIAGSYGVYGLYSTTGDLVYLQIPSNLGKGTHKIDDTIIKAHMNLGKTIDLEFSTIHGGTGTLIVTDIDTKGLKGTFSFTIKNSKGKQLAVSVGQFNVLFK
jgi:major membrane immunogen (membrane-anchored lipoprotein)